MLLNIKLRTRVHDSLKLCCKQYVHGGLISDITNLRYKEARIATECATFSTMTRGCCRAILNPEDTTVAFIDGRKAKGTTTANLHCGHSLEVFEAADSIDVLATLENG